MMGEGDEFGFASLCKMYVLYYVLYIVYVYNVCNVAPCLHVAF